MERRFLFMNALGLLIGIFELIVAAILFIIGLWQLWEYLQRKKNRI